MDEKECISSCTDSTYYSRIQTGYNRKRDLYLQRTDYKIWSVVYWGKRNTSEGRMFDYDENEK